MSQLTLPLFDRRNSQPLRNPLAVTYAMTPTSLVEDIGDHRMIYGLWSHMFGCWQFDQRTHETSELIPTRPFLDNKGLPIPGQLIDIGSGVIEPEMLTPRQHQSAHQAFTAFILSVPTPYRRLAAQFQNYQWLVLDLIWQVPDFAYVVDDANFHDVLENLSGRLFSERAPIMARSERASLARSIIRRLHNDPYQSASRTRVLSAHHDNVTESGIVHMQGRTR